MRTSSSQVSGKVILQSVVLTAVVLAHCTNGTQ